MQLQFDQKLDQFKKDMEEEVETWRKEERSETAKSKKGKRADEHRSTQVYIWDDDSLKEVTSALLNHPESKTLHWTKYKQV